MHNNNLVQINRTINLNSNNLLNSFFFIIGDETKRKSLRTEIVISLIAKYSIKVNAVKKKKKLSSSQWKYNNRQYDYIRVYLDIRSYQI